MRHGGLRSQSWAASCDGRTQPFSLVSLSCAAGGRRRRRHSQQRFSWVMWIPAAAEGDFPHRAEPRRGNPSGRGLAAGHGVPRGRTRRAAHPWRSLRALAGLCGTSTHRPARDLFHFQYGRPRQGYGAGISTARRLDGGHVPVGRHCAPAGAHGRVDPCGIRQLVRGGAAFVYGSRLFGPAAHEPGYPARGRSCGRYCRRGRARGCAGQRRAL